MKGGHIKTDYFIEAKRFRLMKRIPVLILWGGAWRDVIVGLRWRHAGPLLHPASSNQSNDSK